MTIILIILFVLTVLLGFYLLMYLLVDKNTPKGVAIIHGCMGGLSIVLLFITCFFYPRLFFSLVLFILAAGGGIWLIVHDILGEKIPKLLAIGHGTLALVGFLILLLVFIYN